MQLFLTSEGPVVIDTIVQYLPKKPQKLRLAFIPTAGLCYEDTSWIEDARNVIRAVGFEVIDVNIDGMSQSEVEKALEDRDVIYVSGGNTYFLLDRARKSGFFEVVKEKVKKGTVYIGSSAGTALVCPTIDHARRFDEPRVAPDLTDYRGLSLVDFLIFPHFDRKRNLSEWQETIEEWRKSEYSLFFLTDAQFLLVQDKTFQVIERNA